MNRRGGLETAPLRLIRRDCGIETERSDRSRRRNSGNVVGIGGHHAGSHSRSLLAAVARAPCNRRVEARRSAGRMERDEEHPLEDRDSRPRIGVAGRLGRSNFPADRGAGRRVTVAASHAPRGGVQPRDVHRFVVLAIDRRDGRVVWERTAREERPHEASHPENGTWASSSAVTDGEHVFAYFESRGLFAYDMDGKLLWEKDLGDKQMRQPVRRRAARRRCTATARHRLGSLRGSRSSSALDKRTGKEIWRAKREEIDTWATPLVVEHDGRAQVIVPGMNRLRSYDLETGDVVWETPGLTMNPIPSPVDGRRHGVRDERFSRQQPQGDPAGRREGRHHRHAAPSSGRSTATRRTCRRRCCTTASSIS